MVYSKHVNIDQNGRMLDEASQKRLPSGNIFTQLFSEQNFIITSSVIVQKRYLKQRVYSMNNFLTVKTGTCGYGLHSTLKLGD